MILPPAEQWTLLDGGPAGLKILGWRWWCERERERERESMI